jgi:hypothetical protein
VRQVASEMLVLRKFGLHTLLWRARKWVRIMLSRCANVQCAKPFLRLREGKLFLVETERITKPGESAGPPFIRARQQQRQVEHFWLCSECAARYSLIYERERGVALIPLRRPPTSVNEASATANRDAA